MTHADSHTLSGYRAAREPGGAAVQDRSGRAALRLTGADRQSFLQGMVSNDVGALRSGQGCRAALLDSTAHVLADMYVHALPDALLLETDARCAERLGQTLEKYLIMEDVAIADVSQDWVILSVQGDGANDLLSRVLSVTIPADMPPLANLPVPLTEGAEGLLVQFPHGAASGYDVRLPAAHAAAYEKLFISAGAVPLNAEAAEMLRVEAGIAAWGHELDETVLLPEAELSDAVSYTKGCYVGQEIVARLHARGHTNRSLRRILLADNAPVPHPGATAHAPEDSAEAGREIGRITSAVSSPRFAGRALALAYVRKEYADDGTPIAVHIAQPDVAAFSFSGIVTRLSE